MLVFKKSPVCPVSFHAESEYREFLSELGEATDLAVVEIDVADEESERAYFEFVEYVRVGVMTVYSELARARAGSGGDDAPQTEE